MKTNAPNSSAVPLARDANGNVISLPDGAAAWAVRRHTGGRPRNVMGLDRRPLRLPLDATIDDVEAMLGPGTYRLDLVDDNGAPLGVTVPATIGVPDDGDSARREPPRVDEPAPPLIQLPTSGTDLRLLLEANVRAMQLAFHHNERTLDTSLRVVDSLRDGVRVLADAQAQWIKSLATSQTIRNGSYWPPPRARNDEEQDDEDDEEEEDEEYEPTFWEKLGEGLMPYRDVVIASVQGKITDWVTGSKVRNGGEPTASAAAASAPPPAGETALSKAQIGALVAQKIGAAKKLLSEDEVTLLRHLLAKMPDAERDDWIAKLAPLTVEDAVVQIRIALSQMAA